jgi:hypothetical protein
MVGLVQADGQRDLERGRNRGDAYPDTSANTGSRPTSTPSSDSGFTSINRSLVGGSGRAQWAWRGATTMWSAGSGIVVGDAAAARVGAVRFEFAHDGYRVFPRSTDGRPRWVLGRIVLPRELALAPRAGDPAQNRRHADGTDRSWSPSSLGPGHPRSRPTIPVSLRDVGLLVAALIVLINIAQARHDPLRKVARSVGPRVTGECSGSGLGRCRRGRRCRASG